MQPRTPLNVAGATITIPSLWYWIRRGVAAFGDAQAGSDMFGLVKDLNINWDVAYFYLVVLGASLLVAANWHASISYIQKRRKAKVKRWNSTAAEAVNYIAYKSHFARSIEEAKRIETALRAFREAAVKGQVQAVGRRDGLSLLEQIKPHVWRDYTLFHDTERDRNPSVKTLAIKDDGRVIYEGIMVDTNEVMRVWPFPSGIEHFPSR